MVNNAGVVRDASLLQMGEDPWEEVAPLAVSLASEEAGYITGQVFAVYGGML